MADNKVQIVIEAKGGRQAQDEFAKAVKGLIDIESSSIQTTSAMSAMAGRMAGIFAGISFTAVAGEIAEIGMRMESVAAAYNAITGSAAAGARELEFVREQANRMGLEFETSAKAYKGLAAAAEGTVLEGEKVRQIFTAISETSAVLKLTNEETSRAFMAVSQMISKGTVSMEELRGQLGEALPGAFQTAARAMNVTTAELTEMVAKGDVAASDFLPRLARALHEQHGGSVGEAANNANAAINRLKNAFVDLANNIYQGSGFGTAITWAADQLANVFNMLNEAPARFAAFASRFGQTLNLIEATRAANSQFAVEPKLTWGGLKTYEKEQAAADTNAWKQAQDQAAKSKADQDKWFANERAYWSRLTATAQEKAAYQKEILKSLYPYGGDEYEKGIAHVDAQLAKATTSRGGGRGGGGGGGGGAAISEAARALEELLEKGKRIEEDLRTPQEKYNAELDELNRILAANPQFSDTYQRAVEKLNKELEKESQQRWIEQNRELYDAMEQGKELYNSTRTNAEKYAAEVERLEWLLSKGAITQELMNRGLDAAKEKYRQTGNELAEVSKRLAQEIQSSLGDALYNVMSGKFDDIGDAFADMLMRMMADLMSSQIMKWLAGNNWQSGNFSGILGSIFNWFGGGSASAKGNIFGGPGISAFENRIVTKPTLFPFATGIGLMGEAGWEAIMPLTRTSSGDLGVRAETSRPQLIQNITIKEASGTRTSVDRDEQGNLTVAVELIEQSITRRMARGAGMAPYFDGRYRRNR